MKYPTWLLTPTDAWTFTTKRPLLALTCLLVGGCIGYIIHNI